MSGLFVYFAIACFRILSSRHHLALIPVDQVIVKTLFDPDMKFVKKITPPDFQAKHFTPSISPNFNSFSKKKHKKLVKIEKFTPLAKILHCRRH